MVACRCSILHILLSYVMLFNLTFKLFLSRERPQRGARAGQYIFRVYGYPDAGAKIWFAATKLLLEDIIFVTLRCTQEFSGGLGSSDSL